MNWTQEQRDQMIALWDNGARSYSEIARIMGVSKNSVVGRMRREKRLRDLPVMHQFSHKTRGAKKPTFNKHQPKPRRKRVIDLPSIPPPDFSSAVGIVEVTGCRWAVGYNPEIPGGHLFCNHGTDEGQSYCEFHMRENVASYSRKLIRKTTHSALKAYLNGYRKAAA